MPNTTSHQARIVPHLLALARRHNEPFSAVIIEPATGRILATGMNLSKSDPTQHSEMAALRNLIARYPKRDRSALWMYTTAEPCPMCAAALVWCDFGDVVYGIRRPELVRWGWDEFSLRAKDLLNDAKRMGRYSGRIAEFAPLLRKQCVALFHGYRKR